VKGFRAASHLMTKRFAHTENPMFRFQPSVESLETRETPSSVASVTDLVIDSYNPRSVSSGTPTSTDSFYGTGVYKSTDAGKTWTLAPDTGTAAKSDPLPVLLVIANRDF
jgi:hypothetical protein